MSVAAGVALALLAPLAPAAQAQTLAPVVRVDGEVITAYELGQRTAFLTLLRAPGDVRALALDQLINEKLQLREAKKADITAKPEDVQAGMEEFAARGNLTAEKFIQLIGQAGVAPETFRDFVTAGVTWRDYVKATFQPRVSISKAEIAAAMAEAEPDAGLRVLLSEIALPAADPATRKASEKRAGRLVNLDEAAFRDAAMRFSIGQSRSQGGDMNWVDVTALPPNVGAAVRGLKPGQSTGPLPVEDQIRLYYMRDRDEVKGGKPATAVDYAALLLPGGASPANVAEAAKIRNEVTSCDDLYPIARGLPPEQLTREEVPVASVPAAYRAELDTLDAGEISTRLTTANGAMVVLMLCSRGNEVPKSLTEESVALQLKNKRVSTMAQAFLDEVKANASIETFR